MFSFKKSSHSSVLPISQDDEKDSASEQSSMLGHDYLPKNEMSRSWRFWSSNVPWIITTTILAVYILVVVPPNLSTVKSVVGGAEGQCELSPPWSPTDACMLLFCDHGN
jgi:hypothetical protein